MNIPIATDYQVLEEAIKAARRIDVAKGSGGLESITDGTLLGHIEEAWIQIEGALRSGFQQGRDAARAALDTALAAAERLIAESGKRARDVQDRLLRRLQEFMRAFIEGALARVPVALEVGGIKYKLNALKCTQKLLVTGALKTSLTEAFSIVSTGELEVATEYVTA